MLKKTFRFVIGFVLGGGTGALGIPLARWFVSDDSAEGWAAAVAVMLMALAGGLLVFLWVFAEKAEGYSPDKKRIRG